MKNRIQTEPDNDLARTIVGLAMKVHRILGSGFLETVYRNALAHELRKTKTAFECHPTLSVRYDGIEVGIYQADLIIEGKLIVELKAVSSLTDEHTAQLVNYLKSTKIEDGLLLNFGSGSLEFRTKTRTYPSRRQAPDLQF